MESFLARFVLSHARSFTLARHITFWLVWWVFFGIIYGFYGHTKVQTVNFIVSFINSAIYMPQHMLLSYGLIYFVLPKYIFKGHYVQGLFWVVVLLAAAAVISPVIAKYILVPLWKKNVINVHDSFFYGFMAGLRGSMTIAGFATSIKLIKHWYLKKEESARLEKEKLKAELQILKAQLHPHFMFNTLNSIYALSLKQSAKTSQAILQLSDLMRYIIADCNDPLIPLSKEVQVIQHYIELERSRFGERVDISVNTEGNFENKMIAPLLFLPFLENSFKYGTHEMLEQAWISLELSVKDNHLKFKLINGKSGDARGERDTGIGLKNIKKRLALMYPYRHELRISENPDNFVVQLSLHLDGVKLPEN